MPDDNLAKFEKIHAEASELLLLHSRAKIHLPATSLRRLLQAVFPTDRDAFDRLCRAIGETELTVAGLRDGIIDPLTIGVRPVVLLGRAMGFEFDPWFALIATGTTLNLEQVVWRRSLLLAEWARCDADLP